MANAGADARRPLRHPYSFPILLLQLAIRIESLVDSHIDQMVGDPLAKYSPVKFQ